MVIFGDPPTSHFCCKLLQLLSKQENPTYREVCSGSTGHVEVLQIKFDPAVVAYEDLLKFFFSFHDPTTLNRQGNDAGTQYASAIFVHTPEQREIAQKVKAEVQSLLDKGGKLPYEGGKVATSIAEATTFYPAHEEHQNYLLKNPGGYCNHRIRFNWADL